MNSMLGERLRAVLDADIHFAYSGDDFSSQWLLSGESADDAEMFIPWKQPWLSHGMVLY